MTRRGLRFEPAWKLTRWGLIGSALRLNRGCDEWHNPSRWFMVPLVGRLIIDNMLYPRSGPQHLYAYTPETGWEGAKVLGCAICVEISSEAGGLAHETEESGND